MNRITTRRATLADCEILTDICLRSKQSNGYDDAFMQACRAELSVTPATFATNGIWVAEKQAKPLGCAALCEGRHPQEGEVSLFFIDPDAQKQGIGRILWDCLQTAALERKMHSLTLCADPNAVPFYEKIGFKVTSQSPSLSIPGRMLPFMERDIP